MGNMYDFSQVGQKKQIPTNVVCLVCRIFLISFLFFQLGGGVASRRGISEWRHGEEEHGGG